MKDAVYAVSGDPWTKGHTSIVERSLQIFDRVIVAIGVNPKKKYSFDIELRKRLAQLSLKHLGDKVEVDSFEGLLVDYAYKRNIKILIRGMRDDLDFNFEKGMFKVNITQKGVDEIFLFPNPEFEHISSSAVRELQQNQGNITNYVHPGVKQAMEFHLSNQRICGITGLVGVGKTYMANKLCEIGKRIYNIDFHNVELDEIGRDLLTTDPRPFAIEMRRNLFEKLAGEDRDVYAALIDPHNEMFFFNLKKINPIIFKSKKTLKFYNEVSLKPILFEVQQRMFKKTGFIFLNSALLVEADLLPLCNNNVVYVSSSEVFRSENLKSRNYSEDDLKSREKSQLNSEEKGNIICDSIGRDGWGHYISLLNGSGLYEESLTMALNQIKAATEAI